MIRFLLATLAITLLPTRQDPKPQAEKSPPVYDEKADAKAEIAAAIARAKRENRRVLIQWGANWCGWCRRLHELFRGDKDLAKELLYEYEIVRVDVGRWDRNLDLAAGYGATLKESGIPFLTLLDGEGKVLANQDTSSFESKDEAKPGHDAMKVLEFLKGHQASYLKAQDLYDAALSRAKAENRRVFLHFGAPWCGWCRRLESWMASAEVAPLLSKEFIELKIDQDRTVGGSEMLAAMIAKVSAARPGAKVGGGIPWFVFLDSKGNILADSDNEEGNIGFPSQPAEIDHFIGMLQRTSTSLSAGEIDQLRRSLEADREKREKAEKKAG